MAGIVQTIAPAGEPVTLAEAKAWLRVDNTDEDVLIHALIEAARGYVETFTRRALLTQTWALKLDAFPADARWHDGKYRQSKGGFIVGREIVLPKPPLQSVASITYVDTAGVTQTFATSNYHVDTAAQPGRVIIDDDADWPDTDVRPNAVTVTYVAGYGTPSSVPQGLRVALRYLLSHWFENRRHINIGNIVNAIPDTADALLWQHRIPEAY